MIRRNTRSDSPLAGRRLLVTGGSGFLGSHLCSRLVTAGADVYATSRAPRVSGCRNLHWRQADIGADDEIRGLISEVRPDRIFHLAGVVNGAPDRKLVEPTFYSLLGSTVKLLDAAAETGCQRVVLVGSLEEPTGGAESYPTSPYGAAKWAASAYGRMFNYVFGLPVVIARTYMTYGPGQADWKVIPNTILALLRGEGPRLSSGQRQLDWVYVDDVVDGLMRAASAADINGETLDLGSGTLTSIRDMVDRIVRALAPGTKPIYGALPDRPRGAEQAADIARTRVKIGWTPTTSLDMGLSRTIDWYRRQPKASSHA